MAELTAAGPSSRTGPRPTLVRLDLNDCYFGQVRTEADTSDTIDEALVNAATGPVAVRGAQPGDTSPSCRWPATPPSRRPSIPARAP